MPKNGGSRSKSKCQVLKAAKGWPGMVTSAVKFISIKWGFTPGSAGVKNHGMAVTTGAGEANVFAVVELGPIETWVRLTVSKRAW